MSTAPLVEIRGLRKSFELRDRHGFFGRSHRLLAVDGVSLAIPAGSTFGLVGESGSGKSTVAKMLLKLERPDAGTIAVDGRNIFEQNGAEERAYRRTVQAVLQDPYGALSPRLRVAEIIGEPLRAQGAGRAGIAEAVRGLLEAVGLGPEVGKRYPHQFSGGQRQRIAIARALSVDPRILVLDEPVSALDLSVRAQILTLLREMQERLGLTYLFIGHNLATVRYISETVGVMYFGRMVEIGPAREILRRPLHPYTRRLVDIAAMKEPLGRRRLGGELPDPRDPPTGCHFRTRCGFATEACAATVPPMREAEAGHSVACHHFEAIGAGLMAERIPGP